MKSPWEMFSVMGIVVRPNGNPSLGPMALGGPYPAP
jgi:hypothetical protein